MGYSMYPMPNYLTEYYLSRSTDTSTGIKVILNPKLNFKHFRGYECFSCGNRIFIKLRKKGSVK